MKKVLKTTVIILSLLIIMIITAIWYLNNTIASNQVLEEYPSPDNAYKVVVFERDAGATSDFSTQVSIIPVKSSLGNRPGNIFIIDSDHRKAPSGKGGGPDIRVSWVGSKKIIISYSKNARIFKQEKTSEDILIDYQSL